MHPKSIARWRELVGLMIALLGLPPIAVWYIENGHALLGSMLVWVVGVGLYAAYAAFILWAGYKVWRRIRYLERDIAVCRWNIRQLDREINEEDYDYLERLQTFFM